MVEWKKLVSVANVLYGYPFESSLFSEDSNYMPLIRIRDVKPAKASTYYSGEIREEYRIKKGDILVGMDGEFNLGRWDDRDGLLNQRVLKISGINGCSIDGYLFHYMGPVFKKIEKETAGGSVKHLSAKVINNILIPIPSLSEQQRIVSILDTFTSSISNLKQQIEERRKQYEYERDLLLDLEGKEGVEMKKLGEVGDICMCKRIMKNQTADVGDIPFFKIGTFGGVPDAYISRELFEEYKKKYSYPKKGEILISAAGTIGRSVVFDGEDAYFQDSNIVWISNNEQLVLNTFLRYLYGIIDWKIDGGTIKRLYNYNLKNATIYVPSLEAQSRIVSILDTFEQSIANLEEQLAMREKQYEYYRNQLLTFEGEEERGKT